MATNFLKTVSKGIKHWYIPLIIGILLIALGMYMFNIPVESYLTLAAIFSGFFFAGAILQLIFAIQNKDNIDGWGWYLASAILYFVLGFALVSNPLISLSTLPFIFGFYVVYVSISSISYSFELKDLHVNGYGWLTFTGVVGVIFGFFLLWNPAFSGLSLVFLTAFSVISAGLSSIIFSIKLKQLKDFPGKISKEMMDKFHAAQNEYDKAKHEFLNAANNK